MSGRRSWGGVHLVLGCHLLIRLLGHGHSNLVTCHWFNWITAGDFDSTICFLSLTVSCFQVLPGTWA